MVYTELSHESLKAGFIEEVKKYINIAKEFYRPKSHDLQITLNTLNAEIESYERGTLIIPKEKKIEDQIAKKNLKDQILNYNNILTKLYISMGKVYMSEKKYDRASTEFTVAQELYEGQSSFILPYLAEIQFLLGNYSVVNSIINKSQDLGLNATLYPIVEQWKTS